MGADSGTVFCVRALTGDDGAAVAAALEYELVQEPGWLLRLLKEHWGYSSFRPRQQAIVESILAKRDTAVVMPTGGGKSLCYQLPALASERTAVVISPLIALMRDQAASLREMGISAAFVNSTLGFTAAGEIQRRAEKGESGFSISRLSAW